MTFRRRLLVLVLAGCSGSAAIAASEAEQKATLTRLSGEIKLFTNPFLIKKGEGPHVRYRNKFYNVRDAVVGDVLGNKDVVQAGPDATALLIFPNGDQVTVSPGASFEFGWKDGSGDKPVMDVLSGMIRGQIQPGGPRAGLQVLSKTTTMGVRGTDFTVSSWSDQGGSKVTVLRGKIDVKTAEGKTVGEVTAGKTATVANKPAAEAPPAIEPTPKAELLEIQKATAVPPPATEQPMTAEVAKKLENLEKAAVTNTLADIKKADPAQYEALIAKGGDAKPDLYALQTSTVKEAFNEAPADEAVEADAQLAFIETPPPVAPALKAPESDSKYSYALTPPTVLFAWNDLPNTEMYDVQVAADRDFRRITHAQRVRGDTWEKPLESGTYYWRSRGVDEGGRPGGWSETRLVAVNAGGVTPSLVEPAPGSDVEKANFKWTRVGGLDEYKLVVSRDNEFKDVVTTKTTNDDHAAADIVEEGLYYWYVEGTNREQLLASRSEPASFTIGGGSSSSSGPSVTHEDESTPSGPTAFELSLATLLGGYNRSVSGPADGDDNGGASTFEVRLTYDVNERVQVAGQHRQISLNSDKGGDDSKKGVDESETVVRSAYVWPVSNWRPGVRLGYMMHKVSVIDFNAVGASDGEGGETKANVNVVMFGAGVAQALTEKSRWFTDADINLTGGASGVKPLQIKEMRVDAGYSHQPFSIPLRLTYAFEMASTTISYEVPVAPFDAEVSEQRTGLLLRGGYLF